MKSFRVICIFALRLCPRRFSPIQSPTDDRRSKPNPSRLRKRVHSICTDVRLLHGPFKQGQDIAVRHLLRHEPNRFLANFRKEAGLEPKAAHYGGWEAQGIAGHSLGHYLSACSQAWASTGDKVFLRRVNFIVDELAVV